MENMRDRIRQLMQSQHLNQQAFAEKLGISAAGLSSIFNKRTEPTLNHVEAIKKTFPNINLEWLLYGNGPMFVDDPISENVQGGQPHSEDGQERLLDFSAPTPHPSSQRPESPMSFKPANPSLQTEKQIAKIFDKPQRKITEIRLFYDDQTWETFVPKK